jgi:hypothetical protein
MKANVRVLAGAALVAALLGSGAAWADHGHARIGIGLNFGIPVSPWYYPPYPYPYYYPYPSVVAVQPPAPTVYVEKTPEVVAAPVQSAPAPQAAGYWYYCQNPQGYYPYVNQCPGGWMTVLPQAPAPAH